MKDRIFVYGIICLILVVVIHSLLQKPSSNRRPHAFQIAVFKGALNTYYLHVGEFPSTEQGLQALIHDPSDTGSNPRWKGPYLEDESVPLDQWGNEYIYRSPGKNGSEYDIVYLGKDGLPGGSGENADLSNYDLDN